MDTLSDNIVCPVCHNVAHKIEICSEDKVERKTSFGCDKCKCIIYIVQFEE